MLKFNEIKSGETEKVNFPFIRDDFLRFGTIGDGSCFFHAICICLNIPEYINRSNSEKEFYIKCLRKVVSEKITLEKWLDKPSICSLPINKMFFYILSKLYYSKDHSYLKVYPFFEYENRLSSLPHLNCKDLDRNIEYDDVKHLYKLFEYKNKTMIDNIVNIFDIILKESIYTSYKNYVKKITCLRYLGISSIITYKVLIKMLKNVFILNDNL